VKNAILNPAFIINFISRRGINEPDLITNDNLHPSGIMYLEWAKKIYNIWIK